MNKDRKILLIILLSSIIICTFLFISLKIGNIVDNRNRIHFLVTKAKTPSPSSVNIITLQAFLEEHNTEHTTANKERFDSTKVSFFDFNTLIIESAKKYKINVLNYNTHMQTAPLQLSLSADGNILNILSFMNFITNYPFFIEVTKTSIKYNSFSNNYNLYLKLLYIPK